MFGFKPIYAKTDITLRQKTKNIINNQNIKNNEKDFYSSDAQHPHSV
jgi:hypothetical protein